MTAILESFELPLHRWHEAQGARMQPFAGWSMPIHYPLGVLGEHRHTRTQAGLFDVSHMGQILVRSRTPDHLDAARALEALVPIDILGLKPGKQRYGFLTTAGGGIREDLMIANLGDAWCLVVNAAGMAGNLAYLRSSLTHVCVVEHLAGRALLALQGPQAAAVLETVVPEATALRFMDVQRFSIDAAQCWIARSGYTGEDGFEISLPAAAALALADRLVRHEGVRLVGLGARDSLRLEAGLCLHGHDIGEHTTPLEAGLEWAVGRARRDGGARPGGFVGAGAILAQLADGAAVRRVGLRPEGRPVREGAALFAEASATLAVGRVTSGTFGPTAERPVAMGYVPVALTRPGTRLCADVRGQRVAVEVCELPFVPHRYHR